MAAVVLSQEDEEYASAPGGIREESPLMDTAVQELETVEEPQTKQPSGRTRGNVILLTLIAAIGGFLFGYDTGVVSGALLEVRSTFDLSPAWLEGIVSVTVACAAISALLAGFLCEWLGRKLVLQMAATAFTVGAVLMAVSYYPAVLLTGRGVVGVGVGMAAMSIPMYIAEIAPAALRGTLVVMYTMFVTGGQFVATVMNSALSYLSYEVGWRLMLGLAGVPALLMFVGVLFVPESPRWLVFHGKSGRARKVLETMRPSEVVEEEHMKIRQDFLEHRRSKMGCGGMLCRCLASRPVLLALLVGCGLQVFQQLSGINTIMYYSASIIQMAGFSDRSSIWLSTIPSSANFIFTIVGLLLVERLGRRKLLLVSSAGTVISFALLASVFYGMIQSSPEATPITNDTCSFSRCGSCVGHSGCGFCAEHVVGNDSYVHGTCVPSKQLHNGTVASAFEIANFVCPVVGMALKQSQVEVWRHAFKNGTHELYIHFPFPDNYGQRFEYDPTLERVWFPYSCPHSKLAPLALLALFLYIAFFAPGMGSLPWTVNSEIYPTWVRSTAISIATMMNWICNLLVSLSFLTMADELGQPWTFGVYAGLSALGLVFIVFLVPETKGSTLEEVEKLFQTPYFVKRSSVT